MTDNTPICASIGAATCLDRQSLGVPVPGYYCSNDVCLKCPVGSYGVDGKICQPCPFATWSDSTGSSACSSSFTYSSAGLKKAYIPFGVTKIKVRLWGAGGGSDTSLDPTTYVAHSGGSGAYSACDLTVPHSRNVYVIVGGGGGAKFQSGNNGGFGGGGKGYAVSGISSGGGGGRTAIQIVYGTDAVTAGGGGGGSDCGKTKGCGGGGAGGVVGLRDTDGSSGRGGSAIAGGAPGIGIYCNGTAGTKYQGGNGCRYSNRASTAGGGGGYYGGGGGSAYGANNRTTLPKIDEADGGGGGGSSYGGGCNLDSYVNFPGFTGNLLDQTRSGGLMQSRYVTGVGIGGAGGLGGGNPGGGGYATITFVANSSFIKLTAMPSSMPSSGPTGQPTSQPTSGPTVLPLFDPPTSQPTSRPTTINDNPLFAGSRGGASSNFNSMSTQSAIIIFSCIGAVVLCCFILFSCYFQDKYHNKKEEEKLHSLVEHHYNEDEVALDDGEGGLGVIKESGYYRQFGENEAGNPIHVLKDADGKTIPSTNHSGGGFLSRNNSSLGAKKQSFVLRDNRRGKMVSRTSVSTLGNNNGSMYHIDGSAGDMTARSNASTRSMHSRSSNQIVSQVRVKDYQGTGPAPRLIRMVSTAGTIDEVARAHYLSEHQDEVLVMSKFFRRAGLTQKKSQACAEESVCMEAESPRKLNKYVHEVSDFELINLGMDEFDSDMVKEELNREFPYGVSGAPATAHKMVTINTNVHDSTMSNNPTSALRSPGNRSTNSTVNTFSSHTVKHHIEEDDDEADLNADVRDMIEFFRFAGLSVKTSRHCAKQCVAMDANTPRKLNKYLEEVKGFHLTDLGMDIVDNDMVLKTLHTEYGAIPGPGSKTETIKGMPSPRSKQVRNESVIVDLDLRDDSSDDEEDEITTHSSHGPANHKIKNMDVYDDGKAPSTFASPAKANALSAAQHVAGTPVPLIPLRAALAGSPTAAK